MRVAVGIPLALAAVLVLAACGPSGSDAETIDPQIDAAGTDLATDPDVTVVADLEYGAVDGEPLLLDACLPPGFDPSASSVPGILVVHGGSWREGRKDSVGWRAVCTWLAGAGYPAFSVEYRLAPEHPFPAGSDDVRAAVEWLRADEQAERFGIDPERLGIFGGSAGGNLAALTGDARPRRPRHRVARRRRRRPERSDRPDRGRADRRLLAAAARVPRLHDLPDLPHGRSGVAERPRRRDRSPVLHRALDDREDPARPVGALRRRPAGCRRRRRVPRRRRHAALDRAARRRPQGADRRLLPAHPRARLRADRGPRRRRLTGQIAACAPWWVAAFAARFASRRSFAPSTAQ